jgi:hypothetical protein
MSEILPSDIFWWQTPKSEKAIEKDITTNLLSVFITELVALLSGESTQDLFQNLFFKNEEYGFKVPGEGSSAGGIQMWLQKYYLSQGKIRPQLVVSETIDENFLVEVNVSGIDQFLDENISLKNILSLDVFSKQRLEVLQTKAILVDFVPGLEQQSNTGGKDIIVMDNETFTPFLFVGYGYSFAEITTKYLEAETKRESKSQIREIFPQFRPIIKF